MKICYILDDQYWQKIYEDLKTELTDWDFPIKENIYNPLSYLDEIIDRKPDYILLDNFFPWETREEALGEEFLAKIIEKKLKTNIICISDYGQKLTERYFAREEATNIWLIKWRERSKDGKKMLDLIVR